MEQCSSSGAVVEQWLSIGCTCKERWRLEIQAPAAAPVADGTSSGLSLSAGTHLEMLGRSVVIDGAWRRYCHQDLVPMVEAIHRKQATIASRRSIGCCCCGGGCCGGGCCCRSSSRLSGNHLGPLLNLQSSSTCLVSQTTHKEGSPDIMRYIGQHLRVGRRSCAANKTAPTSHGAGGLGCQA
jgi:hypothetical protein